MCLSSGISLEQLLNEVNTEGIEYKILPHDNQIPEISDLNALHNASKGDISFLSNPKFAELLFSTQASAIILSKEGVEFLKNQANFAIVQCEDPYLLYARVAQWFDNNRLKNKHRTIHPTAVIHDTAIIGANVAIGPYTVIEENVVIDSHATIGAQCFIGANSRIGSNTLLHPQVSIYHQVTIGKRCIFHSQAVIGADGFGFAPDSTHEKGAWCKIAQLGGVVIGDDVEIGSCTTVDRGALENTLIGNGVKLDNQIMIGHNCQIGDHTAMAACVGVAGSTIIGKRCTLAGAAMISGHIRLVDDVHISGATPVMASVLKPGRHTAVFPLAEHKDWQKNAAVLQQLSSLRKRLRQLEKVIKVD